MKTPPLARRFTPYVAPGLYDRKIDFNFAELLTPFIAELHNSLKLPSLSRSSYKEMIWGDPLEYMDLKFSAANRPLVCPAPIHWLLERYGVAGATAVHFV